MRKYIIGFLAGIIIATAGVAAADTVSLVGKKIQSEAIVTLDGEEIGTALIVDGTSYPPLRVIAEAVGVGVGYEKGEVKLNTLEVESKTAKYWESRIESLNSSLTIYTKLIVDVDAALERSDDLIVKWDEKSKTTGISDTAKENYISLKEQAETEQLEIRRQLSEYQAKVAEIESDLALAKAELAEAQSQ